MKLVSFSVTNYRSITKAHRINLEDYTVLVGKNNEGKSNLLTALGVAMNSMIQYAEHKPARETRYYRSRNNVWYSWERDFPIQFQLRRNGLESIFRLEFRLEGDENSEFTTKTGIRCNESIPIDIKFGKDNSPKISIPKRGSGSFKAKSEIVISFICSHISFNYIQAVRTEDMALQVVERIILNELNKLSENEEYHNALETIERIHSDVYKGISDRLLSPLKEFMPQLVSVMVKDGREGGTKIRLLQGNIDIILDDGTPTSIMYKGDGVKSLVTLALLKEVQTSGASIIAIEEPESHLHPEAIHGLVNVINGISSNHQVIISTHNPLFIRRSKISQNIIINDGTAKPAKSIKEIRDLLGVLPEDNLINASNVLVVEGEDDKISLTKILSGISPVIRDAFSKNTLVIQPLNGAGNLTNELTRLRAYLCKYFVFLDFDAAGKQAAAKALEKKLLTEADIKYSVCNGSPEAELEDCFNPDFYIQPIQAAFSVNLKVSAFRGNKKWSDRVKAVFNSQGQDWNDQIEQRVKMIVAESMPDQGINKVLNSHKRGSIDALAEAVSKMIEPQ